MNKTQLVAAVAKDARLSKTDAASAVDALVNTVQKSLKKGDDVRITGSGSSRSPVPARGPSATPRLGRRSRPRRQRPRSSRPGATEGQAVNGKKR